jgi:hypothetical protein
MNLIENIGKEFIFFLMEAAPYMLLGFFVAGLLKVFLPDDFVKKHIGSGKKAGILKASAFGIPIPLCSCGVVPAAAGIRKQGGGKGSVVSFLVSTPETGVDSIAITYALLGPVMAVIRPVAAFFSAIVTGFMVHFFDKDKLVSANNLITDSGCGCKNFDQSLVHIHESHNHCSCSNGCKEDENNSFLSRFKMGMRFAFVDLIEDISLWFIIGVFFAAIIAVFVTPEMVEAVSGGNRFIIMGAMLAVSIPLYVCASSSTPVAAAFLMTGISPGAALIFLLAGPATNAASFSMISRILGKKSAVIYLLGVIITSTAAALATDWIFFKFGFEILSSSVQTAEEPGFYIKIICAAILSVLLVVPLFKNFKKKFKI